MKHPSSRRLFEYWDRRRGNRPAPERGEIEPAAIRGVLGDTFILAWDRLNEPHFRLAGTKVCALFCRELKGQSFVDLWEQDARASVRGLLEIVSEESAGIVAGAQGEATEGTSLELEMLLLPLKFRGRIEARLLGLLAPFEIPFWLGATPLQQLRLTSLRHLGPAVEIETAPRFVSAAETAKARPELVVYQGGRPE